MLGQRILRIDHQHKLVAKNRVNFQARGFDGQGYYADVNRAVLQLLYNLVAEVAVDADLNPWIEPAIFGEHLGQDVKTCRLVGADQESSARGYTLIGNRQQGLIAHLQKPL